MHTITPIPALADNYIWAIQDPSSSNVVIVDPGEARPVHNFLQYNNLSLSAILLTHHHLDHVGGVDDLLHDCEVEVYGANSSYMPMVTKHVAEGDDLYLAEINLALSVMEIPAHTLDHVAYYNQNLLFCGDTLFTAGCGRIFEGTPQQMYAALARLAALDPQTQIYCGHEYTINNLSFALNIEPNNQDMLDRMQQAQDLLDRGLATVPAPIEIELKTNPFLRSDIPTVKKAAEEYAQMELPSPLEVFATLRAWKNSF